MIAQRMSLDIISNLPSYIIETILCYVPIQDAARTSILSRKWRYKWTKIPKLEFYQNWTFGESTDENELSGEEETIASERKKMGERCKVFYTIYQVLLMRQGPIHEFILRMEVDKTCVEIDHIINHLSRNNAVKKLKHDLSHKGSYYWIPLSIFSLQQLTDLYLFGCDLNLKSTFNGFRNLTSLYLKDVYISRKTLLHLVSNCPLKTFTVFLHDETIICDEPDDKYTVIELFDCLPLIERLTTWSWITECFVLHPVPQELPTFSLLHLRYFSYRCMSGGLYFLAFLMRCSPNVEKIEIEIFDDEFFDEMISVILKPYSDICLEHLNELKIIGFYNMKPNLELVKFILAKSPKLKKVLIDDMLDKNEESEILLRSPPASPVVKFITDYY